MIATARARLRELAGLPGADDPMLWDDLPGGSGGYLQQAVADVCRDTDCHNTSVRADLIAGQDRYCGPTLYKIEYAGVTDGGGDAHPLRFATPEQMDARAPGWRLAPESGRPRLFVAQGLAAVRLYPVPDAAFAGAQTVAVVPAGQTAPVTVAGVPGGLYLEGFGVPDVSWVYGAGECPLPARAHPLVVTRALVYRAMDRPDLYAPRLPALESRYEHELGQLEREAHRFTPATRARGGRAASPRPW